jgi:hypothetical protein
MQQALPLRHSEHERSCKPTQPLLRRGQQSSSTILTLMPKTIRRSMRNTFKPGVLNGVADQRQTCSMAAPGSGADTQWKLACRPSKVNVALLAEAV